MCRRATEDISPPSALSCRHGFVVDGPELVSFRKKKRGLWEWDVASSVVMSVGQT